MLIQPTLDTLNGLKLHGMALGLSEQMTHTAAQGLAFEERLALLLEREVLHRENRRLKRLWKLAQPKEREAVVEDIDYRSRQGLERSQLASLASCEWIRANQNILIHGATGSGADGSFRQRLAAIAKTSLLVIDDFAISPIGPRERNDLLELL